ncbi:MAG: dihydrofolate reductase [Pseudomonadota bacterium]
MNHPQLSLIVAMDAARGIGINNTLPWKLPEDLAHFKRTTSGHPIIMGRKTYDSIGRPLPGRRNIVITRNADWQAAGVDAVTSLAAALDLVGTQRAYVIGGAQIYASLIAVADELIVTEIARTFDCDAFFPAFEEKKLWQEVAREPHHSESNDFDYAFVTYKKVS